MKFTQTQGYEALSRRCADEMLHTLRQNPAARLCLATGHSPLLAYRLFAQDARREGLAVNSATFIKLDEWHGPAMEDECTCEAFLQRELLRPLGIAPEKTAGFNSAAQDPAAECKRVCALLETLGPIDLMILGVGRNGHLGLNEPAASLLPRAHVAALQPKTLGHSMLAGAGGTVRHGMTLGMADILGAARVLLLFTGPGKQAVRQALLAEEIRTEVPATLLHLHGNCECLLAAEP